MAASELRERLRLTSVTQPVRTLLRDIVEEVDNLESTSGAFGTLTADDFTLTDSSWEDLRFPLVGRNIDVTSGRIDYDFYNGSVTFATNARYHLSETISFIVQLPHAWKSGTNLKPHIHWIQQGSSVPNWTLGYKIYKKGTATTLESDFSNHTLLIPASHAFTYTSGAIEQITIFPDIPGTGMGLSDIVHICLWRDSANDSSAHAGSDPSAIVEHVREFDVHVEIDSFGSDEEYSES